jgi:hypothetical protein
MNLGGHGQRAKALQLSAPRGPGSFWMNLRNALDRDERSVRAASIKPRLPELSFTKRTLPNELRWPREAIPAKELEL